MDKNEFLKQQFITLREEIKEAKSRVFKTVGFGLVVVPASHFLAKAYQIDTVILSIPVLVIVVALLYLSENNSIMRAGQYIKINIEPYIDEVVGWEEWLETPGHYETRDVDKYLSYCFYLLFFIYFLGSSFNAARFTLEKYDLIPTAALVGAYMAIGIWFLIFLIRKVRVSTGASLDVKRHY